MPRRHLRKIKIAARQSKAEHLTLKVGETLPLAGRGGLCRPSHRYLSAPAIFGAMVPHAGLAPERPCPAGTGYAAYRAADLETARALCPGRLRQTYPLADTGQIKLPDGGMAARRASCGKLRHSMPVFPGCQLW